MYRNFMFNEVTKDNENKYLDGIVELEDVVYENMIKQGKAGQLFTTGREDISSYINSSNNSVFVVTTNNEKEKVVAATYITQGQIPFTYNDVTKYFKCSEKYMLAVKEQYKNEKEYLALLRKIYIQKITAFIYSRDVILKEYVDNIYELSEDEKNAKFLELVKLEVDNPENNFHEKSKIRDELNKNMSLYMHMIFRNSDLYEKFYWIDMNYLIKQNGLNPNELEIGKTKYSSTMKAYDKILALQKYNIYEASQGLDEEKYYGANTSNTIELDTYITSDSVREFGLARIIVFEGIKRVLERQHMGEKNGQIYLVSTLHRDNLSSKYVSEFFGLKDNLYVNRRMGRNREVHICRINKNEIKQYLEDIEKKLIVLYNYNPNGIVVNDEERIGIFESQLEYENNELKRLENLNDSKYTKYIDIKRRKIDKFKAEIEKIKNAKDISE